MGIKPICVTHIGAQKLSVEDRALRALHNRESPNHLQSATKKPGNVKELAEETVDELVGTWELTKLDRDLCLPVASNLKRFLE